jgi:hypothetical protein
MASDVSTQAVVANNVSGVIGASDRSAAKLNAFGGLPHYSVWHKNGRRWQFKISDLFIIIYHVEGSTYKYVSEIAIVCWYVCWAFHNILEYLAIMLVR